MDHIKIIARQAKAINAHKNSKIKLMKCCANIYFKSLSVLTFHVFRLDRNVLLQMTWRWPLARPKHTANFDTQSNITTRVVIDWLFFGILLLQHTTGWIILSFCLAVSCGPAVWFPIRVVRLLHRSAVAPFLLFRRSNFAVHTPPPPHTYTHLTSVLYLQVGSWQLMRSHLGRYRRNIVERKQWVT
jgi:hypothetical protein